MTPSPAYTENPYAPDIELAPAKGRDILLAVILFFLLLLFCNSFVYAPGIGLGLSLPLLGVVCSAGVYLARKSCLRKALACLLCGTTALLNPDRMIADYNVDAYLQGQHENLDVNTLRELCPEASAPALLRLYRESEKDHEKNEARRLLLLLLDEYFVINQEEDSLSPKPLDLRSWNLPKARCQDFLQKHWQKFYFLE